jgi:excisionase family DNA binding protein
MAIHTLSVPRKSEGSEIRQLSRMLRSGRATLVGDDGTRLRLPIPAMRILEQALRNIALGQSVALVPQNRQLTTQRAADLLGVSRPHLVKLLESGQLPHHKTGSHRRVYLNDLLAYQKHRDAGRKRSLNRLAREAFDAGLYDRTGIPDGGQDE